MFPRIFCLLVMFAVANAYNYGQPTFLISMANAMPPNIPMPQQQNMPSFRQSSAPNQLYMGNPMPMSNSIRRSSNPMYTGSQMYMPHYMQRRMPNYINGMPMSMYMGYPRNMLNFVPNFMSMMMPMNRRRSRQRGADVDRPDGMFDLDYPIGMRGGWGGSMGGRAAGFMSRYNQLESMDLI